jgi:hypothetical protein
MTCVGSQRHSTKKEREREEEEEEEEEVIQNKTCVFRVSL